MLLVDFPVIKQLDVVDLTLALKRVLLRRTQFQFHTALLIVNFYF